MLRLIIIFGLLISLYSCKKEVENTQVHILFQSPTENQSFQAGDTVQIIAQLKDDYRIKGASLFLVESNTKMTKGAVKNFSINAKEYKISYAYILPKNGLNSTEYYFEIQANDGQQSSAAFLSIRINQPARVKLGWLFMQQNTAQTTIFKLDSMGKPLSKMIDVAFEVKDFAIDMPSQHLWLLPKGKNDLLTIDLVQQLILNRIIPPSTQFTDAFSSILFYKGKTFVGDNNGLLQGYNTQFSDVFTYRSDQNYHIELMDANEVYILAVEQGIDFSKSRIRMLYRLSGGVVNSSVISKNMRAISLISSQRAYLLCDYNGGIEFFDYDINRGVYTSLVKYSLSPNESFYRFQKIKDGAYLLVTSQKVYKYLPPHKLKLITSGIIEDASYDSISDEVAILVNDSLKIVNDKTLTKKAEMPLRGTFKFVIPWHSR